MIKLCECCGKEFVQKSKTHRFCSKKCCDKKYQSTRIDKTAKARGEKYRKTKKFRERYRRYRNRADIKEKRRIKQREIMQNENEKFKAKVRKYTWDHLRETILSMNGDKCSVCGRFCKTIIHHKVYRFPPKLNDCILLCQSCHTMLHNGLKEGIKND